MLAGQTQRLNVKPDLFCSRLSALAFLFFILGFFLAPTIAFSAEQPGFTVQGQLRYEAFQADGTNRLWTRKFKMTAQDCSWVIESTDVASGDYQVSMRTDGVVHSLTRMNPTKDPALNDFFEVIEDDAVPASDTVSGNGIVWLAFASNCYLKSVKDDRYEPVWMLDDPNLRKEGFTMSGVLNTLDGYLPKELVYLNKGTMIARSDGQRIFIHAPPTFHGALTNAIYHVIESTNLGSIQIPTSFEFKRFGLQPDFTTTHLLTRITGSVTHIEQGTQLTNEMPDLKGISYVHDNRFVNAKTSATSPNYRMTR